MENLKDIVARAKEAVEELEEPLKTEGFKTVLARLLDSNAQSEKQEKVKKTFPKQQKTERNDEIDEMCSKINRTEFPKIHELKKALDQALYTLKIARDVAGIDGLLPLQISRILGSVFKIRVTSAAVNMALGNVKTYVDRKPVRVKGGQGYKYFLMHEGETYLEDQLKKTEED